MKKAMDAQGDHGFLQKVAVLVLPFLMDQ